MRVSSVKLCVADMPRCRMQVCGMRTHTLAPRSSSLHGTPSLGTLIASHLLPHAESVFPYAPKNLYDFIRFVEGTAAYGLEDCAVLHVNALTGKYEVLTVSELQSQHGHSEHKSVQQYSRKEGKQPMAKRVRR